MILASAIFLITLLLVIWQPWGLGIGWSSGIGALIALLFGVISIDDIPIVWNIIWNATFAFIAIIIISLLLDEAGFFRWIALHVAKLAAGSVAKLFVFLIILGAIVSAFFANDGAALILTPIVIAVLASLRLSAGTTLAFIMAAGFIADTASLPLVVSNLVNIVSADFFEVSFERYALVMVPVNLVSVLTSLIVLYWFFHKDVSAKNQSNYDVAMIQNPKSAIVDKSTFLMGWLVLALLLIGFFVLEPLGIPISAIAGVGSLILLATSMIGKKIEVVRVVRSAPWSIVAFSLGMYLVVYGLKNAGLTDYLTSVLNGFVDEGVLVTTVATGFLSAALSSVMNNMPTVLIQALSIDAVSMAGSTKNDLIKEAMVFANIIGCNLGPKITPIGSLATLLWLHILASKNIKITWGYYFKLGMILTLPVLMATLLALAGWLSILHTYL